jgi:hypothetical protein
MGGRAEQKGLFFISMAGYLIDDRRDDAPVPAASRLFVDLVEGAKTMVPLGRAFLRTAIDLWLQNRESEPWTRWFRHFIYVVANSHWAPEIGFIEAPRLREWFQPAVQDGYDEHLVTFEQLRQELGRWVPMHSRSGCNRGLSRLSWQNRFLFADRETRVQDGVTHIDLDVARATPMTREEWEAAFE